MPAIALGVRNASRFEVVGEHGMVPLSVTHVALLSQQTRLDGPTEAEVFDMGPPLRISTSNLRRVHTVGWLPMTLDEEEQLDVWLAHMRTLVSDCRYIAFPAEEPIKDPVNGTTVAWRFSCAGFVSRAYQEGAGVNLIVGERDLPELSLTTLRMLWMPDRSEDVARRVLGAVLRGPGPWRVLVPGYLFHALGQARAALPYRPSAFELFFPIPNMSALVDEVP